MTHVLKDSETRGPVTLRRAVCGAEWEEGDTFTDWATLPEAVTCRKCYPVAVVAVRAGVPAILPRRR